MESKTKIADTAVAQQTKAAETALDAERESLEDERAALSQFRKRIANIDVSRSVSSTATAKVKNAIMGGGGSTTSTDQLEQVQDAYRETVMSVPHYEDDYDHSLLEDLTEEFGPELGNAFATADFLTPPLHETLLTASQQATEARTAMLDELDHEAKRLQNARDTLEELNTTLTELNQQPVTAWATGEIIATHNRLDEFESQCNQLAANRQAELHNQRIAGRKITDEGFNEYLYESLPVTYPVLADLAEFSSLLHTARQQLEQRLTHR
jgi:6-pyruvoyl-tetrahydropterin synthase